MKRRHAVVPVVWLLSGALFGAAAFADDPQVAAVSEPGVWQRHQYNFQFFGFTTTYSCDGLAGKLKVLLIAAGARADAKSWPGACAQQLGRPDKFASASLTFYTLTPVTMNPSVAGPQLDGVWRAVSFARRSPRELAIGDCELVEQFRDKVLPLFSTRNIDSNVTCVPHQESGSNINLKFDSFAAIVPPKR